MIHTLGGTVWRRQNYPKISVNEDCTPLFQDSGARVDDVCKPKLAKILSDGNALINRKQLDQTEEVEVTDKMTALKERTQRVDTAVTITRMKYA